uniref:N(6)-L-threonylcarbamoyladenine synthase n=1 Tax=Paulinella chromatophora TaxID=39717 RepID=B1X5F7_PAUCH|nr:probable o-sialoglycoprotein endopeptidase [Paulinella chromatophora]ACB43176.1 probable o-sialoglycoprotein endopeptidase [Paulinella chromatophora]
MPILLALETSCDESAAALVTRQNGTIKVLASAIASQVDEHSQWGGVVPEIASRRHLEALPGLISQVFEQAGCKPSQINAVAATVTPGLAGALLVGSVTARTLSRLYKCPFIAIHHLEGHLCSVQLGSKFPPAPFLVLLVSGGHTELIRVNGPGDYLRLGRSHDDAAGEAFDKVARLLNLSYPGGPAIQEAALGGKSYRFLLPKGRISLPNGGIHPYDFSFSGLKTAILRLTQRLYILYGEIPMADLAASFEQIVAEILVERTCRCAIDEQLSRIVLVGGVAANKRLRLLMETSTAIKGLNLYMTPLDYCTDNAAMIGVAALERLERFPVGSPIDMGISPRLDLESVTDLYMKESLF